MPNYRKSARSFLIPLSILIISITCHAQTPQMGMFIGAQATSANYFVESKKQPNDYKYGFQLGYTMKMAFETNLFFSPAAFYSLKGYKVRFNNYAYPPDVKAVDNNTTIHTFELAALLQYDFGAKPNHFFIKLGPSLDFQLKGKETYNLMNGTSVSHDMIYSFGEYGHYSANLLFHFGYETKKGLMFFGQYTHGIANISNADYGPRINHKAFGLAIGKYFGVKK